SHLTLLHHDLLSFPTRRSSDLWVHFRCSVLHSGRRSIESRCLNEPQLGGLNGRASVHYNVETSGLCALRSRLANDIKGQPNSLRSEEHTSELQSRFELVCRLLL